MLPIDQITAAGFDVYMRDPSDTYCYFTDGTRIGYLQLGRLEGLSLTTVHKPNTQTGTGFGVIQGLGHLDRKTLELAFVTYPNWPLYPEHRASVHKYKDMAAFLKADHWNSTYKLVAKGTPDA